MAVMAVQCSRDAAGVRRAFVGAGVRRLFLALAGELTVAVTGFVMDMDAMCFFGIALVSVLVAAGLTLGGSNVAALPGMLPVVGAEGGVRFRRKRPGRAKVQAQGQGGENAEKSLHVNVLLFCKKYTLSATANQCNGQ